MKSKFLPLRYFIIILGFIAFFTSSVTYAGTPDVSNAATQRMQKIRANQNTGVIDTKDALKAQTEVYKMTSEKAMSDINLNWKELGPNNAAGRTRSVLFSNKDASGQTMLTGGVTGGIWKSRNLGLTWHEMNTQSNEVLRVTSMVQTTSGTIYVSTGEAYCGNNQYMGTGIYRSDDDSTFTQLASTVPVLNDPASDWAYIAKLAVSSTGRIYAATSTGLKYSDDGNSWTTAITGYAYTVVVGTDGTVLADVDHLGYLALAGSTSFNLISTNLSTTLPNYGVNGIEFAIAPTNDSIMYASLANTSGTLLNVYKSRDKGATWFIIFPGNSTFIPLSNGCYANALAVFPDDPNQVYLGGLDVWHGKKYTETGYYNWEMVSFSLPIGAIEESVYQMVSNYLPSNQHQIVFRPNSPTQFGIATDDGISLGTTISTGASYQHLIKNLVISQFNSVAYSIRNDAGFGGANYIGVNYVPGDDLLNEPQNSVQLNPSSTFGGDVQWSMIYPSSIFFASGSATGQPYTRSEDLGTTPSPTFMSSLANATANNSYVVADYWEDFNFIPSVDTIKFVEKAQAVPKDSVFIVQSANEKFPMHVVATHDIAIGDTVKVQDRIQTRFFIPSYISGTAGIYMSKQALQYDVDPAWFRIAAIGSTDIITCIKVSQDLGVLWAGTSTGKLFRLTNITYANDSITASETSSGCVIGHHVYTDTVYPQFAGRYITSISIDPANNNNVLVTLGNYGNSTYVYKTTNGLAATPTFVSAQGALPAMPVYAGVYEMTNHNTVILGTEYGVFATTDITAGTPVWSAQNTGTGNVPVTMIKQQTNPGLYYYRPDNYGELFLASYGRGMFYDSTYSMILGVDPGPAKPAADNRLKVQPNPFTGNVTIAYKIGKTSPVNAMIYDLQGRMIYTTSFGTQQHGDHTQTLNLSNLPTGTYIIKLDYGTGSLYGKAVKIN
jgi:hypothetical protein